MSLWSFFLSFFLETVCYSYIGPFDRKFIPLYFYKDFRVSDSLK